MQTFKLPIKVIKFYGAMRDVEDIYNALDLKRYGLTFYANEDYGINRVDIIDKSVYMARTEKGVLHLEGGKDHISTSALVIYPDGNIKVFDSLPNIYNNGL